MKHSTTTAKRNKSTAFKPKKPYPDFPLFPHASGRWAKKIKGSFEYFGRWGHKDGDKIVPVDDVGASAQEAADLYAEQREDLYAGRPPRLSSEGLTLRELCNQFVNAKKRLLENDELTVRSFRDYHQTCERVIAALGKNRSVDDLAADDFGHLRSVIAKTRGHVALGNEIGRVRMVFKFAFDEGLIDKPIRYGQSFNKPSKTALRKERAKNGKRMFEADELRRIIGACDPIMQAMVLLAINCGFGNSDVSNLPFSAVDLDKGWIDYPRPKTGVERRCPLWPETVDGLREASVIRPEPKDGDDADCVFLTRYGNRWVRMTPNEKPEKRTAKDAIAGAFGKLLKSLDINGHRNFYAIHHSFETVGGESKDQVAVDAIMGHIDNSMASLYRERISDARLQAVVDVVHSWLWPSA